MKSRSKIRSDVSDHSASSFHSKCIIEEMGEKDLKKVDRVLAKHKKSK